MSVDIYKIKPGDKVTVELIAGEYVASINRLVVHTKQMAGFWQMPVEYIVGHVPAPREIKVGDMVTWEGGYFAHAVRGLHGDEAWLPSAPRVWNIVPVKMLRHYDPDQR